MGKLTKAQREGLAFKAFKASLTFQRVRLGRGGFMSEAAYWDGKNDVREHWLLVTDAVLTARSALNAQGTET